MKRRDFVGTVAAAGVVGMLPAGAPGRLSATAGTGSTRLDTGWRFFRGDAPGAEAPRFDDSTWEQVMLPHTARIEALVTGPPGSESYQWQGVCWYRLPIRLPEEAAGKRVFLHFEAAMNVAEVWLDGAPIGRHPGGFLPFVFDVSERVRPGGESILAVRLDNRDDPVTGPKPLHLLDFNMYHGLYRYVHLVVKDPLHITDPILADQPGGGGVFVTFPEATEEMARVRVQVHVRNDDDRTRAFRVRTALIAPDGTVAARGVTGAAANPPGMHQHLAAEMQVHRPALWSPRSPTLYRLRTEVVDENDLVIDSEETRVGIRRIRITREGFSINGERMFLRGTNRHQEHPYVGYAVPAEAQHRDAQRIKDAGFDYVRLSHYPHSPAFMDACDELGLVVMNCIPGWQYFGEDPAFTELQYRNSRELIRRDRNRPSVIMWEVSLNETAMSPEFIRRTHEIAHREYPGDQCYSCGWMPGYDVFIRARQHGGCPPGHTDQPCVVSEYGDWEYYAMTAGLNQESFQALSPAESNSRQLRWQGERALLQQATNFQEAHNDNLGGAAFGDGLWVMFDYNRGYAPDIESSGCMDIFRLPKYAYHFYRSQRSPTAAGGPMVFIASEWSAESLPRVRVFSNCEQVELRLNGRTVSRQRPDRDRVSTHLPHPPFTFRLDGYVPGTLEAVGFLNGAEAARTAVRTAGTPQRLELSLALRGRGLDPRGKDLVFCHASLLDGSGTVVPAAAPVGFGGTGNVRIIGMNPFYTEAGIASVLMETVPGRLPAAAFGVAIVRDGGGARVMGGAVSAASLDAGSAPPAYELRYTTDRSEPGAGSARYAGPIAGEGPLRAALLVGGRVVASVDEGAPPYRVPISAPPESREPFRGH